MPREGKKYYDKEGKSKSFWTSVENSEGVYFYGVGVLHTKSYPTT